MKVWVAVLLVGAGSYLFRVAPLFSVRCRELSVGAQVRLERAGVASLAALTSIAVRHQTIDAAPGAAVASAVALVVGATLALRGRPLHVVALGGVATHVALTACLSVS